LKGLGSTAAVLLIRNDVAYIAYVGDSPIYLLRKNRFTQISEDQTTAAALVRSGHLTAEDAENHPLKNSLEEYVGKEGRLEPGTKYRTLQAGDRWLLCSDGLTKGMTKTSLRQVLLQYSDPHEACQTLVETAKEADGTDNITAIVVDIVDTPGGT
jgi:serine/threonine protein phosphatase PrpC